MLPGCVLAQAISSATVLNGASLLAGEPRILQHVHIDEANDRREILFHPDRRAAPTDIVEGGGVPGSDRARRQQDRVTVGFCLRHDLGADDGAAARAIVDDHLLAEELSSTSLAAIRADVSVGPPGA